jgi:hypothetical protein
MKGLKINISTDAENSLLKLARARILNLNRKQTAKMKFISGTMDSV